MAVKVWFVGRSSVEHPLRRVAARVAAGGHDIPETKIHERWESSRLNLVRIFPHLSELALWDNSAESDWDKTGPRPALLLHAVAGRIIAPETLAATPSWAKAIVAAALKQRVR